MPTFLGRNRLPGEPNAPRRCRRRGSSPCYCRSRLILMLGTWEVGHMVEVEQILNNAVREGGRCASTGLNTNSEVQQTVLNYLQNSGLPSTSATVTVFRSDASGHRLHFAGDGVGPIAGDGHFAIQQLSGLVGLYAGDQ